MPLRKHRRSIRSILALLLSLALLAGVFPLGAIAESVNDVSVSAAPLSSSASTADGMVRVFLSSLGYPTSLTLTIAGSYSINGDSSRSLSNGSTVTVGFSSSTGAITLTQNGQRYNMGKQFSLKRHSATGTNGVKIAQAEKSGNLYPGDVSFEAVSSGSGYRLYTVVHVFIENYLYGVLPYEMGNSNNIEALKSQAVAARTYTVRMMKQRASGRYDVVDTTSDQVYYGTPSGNANCVAAINATKGIVLMYGSSYATTYYSASNGGQTETASNGVGGSNAGYLVVKDDPFDYANPSCVVKSKTVYKDLTSSMNPSALISLLKSKAVAKISGATNGNTTLQTLKSVTPHTPKYVSPSRLYTKMDFNLVASVGGRSVTTTVTCDIFGELESMLSMSIQSKKNELWSVKSASSSFTLQARRYGHGVGMSQRGAMYMAKLGYTYDEILGFYYPGCKRVQHSFTNTILSGSGGEQITLEDPAELGEEITGCKGTVKLVSASASIAIRASKSTTGAILGTAGNGASMSVLANDGSWCFVKYGDLQGYLPANSLTITGTPSSSEGAVSSVSGFATVTANDYVNLRDSGSMSGGIVSTAPSGAVMTVFSQSGSWARVQYCATVAYVNTGYVSISGSYPSATVSTGSATATVTTEDGTGSVNLRESASTDGKVLKKVPSGTQVNVSSDDGSWSIISYEGVTGYMLSSFLTMEGESLEGGATVEQPDDAPTSTGATVSADLGYLREQPNANAASLLLIAQGEAVTVTSRGDEWCGVTYGDMTGYMLTSSLAFSGGGAQSVTTAIVTTASGSLNLRAEARAGSAILTTIPRHAQVDITSVGATWCGVAYGGYAGYAMSSFLTLSGSAGGATQTPSEGDRAATVATQSGSLNLRAEARAGSEILRTIPQYAAVTVHQVGAEWCNVTYLGTTGYVMTVFLAIEPEKEPDAPDTGDETPDGTENPDGTTDPDGTTNPDGTTDPDGTTNPDGTTKPDGTTDPDGTTNPDETTDPDGTETPDANDPDEPLVGDKTDENTLYAVVSTVSGSLNLRQDALPGSDVIGRIPKGTTIVIEEKLSAWSRTSYAGRTGYVMNAFLSFHQGQLVSDDAESATVTTASGSLNLRTEPSMNGGVILRIPQYATVSVQQRGETWCYLAYSGSMGYAMTQYLTFSTAVSPDTSGDDASTGAETGGTEGETGSGTDTPNESGETNEGGGATNGGATPDYQTAYVQTTSGSLNLRESPKSGAEIVRTIPRGAAVQVYEYGAEWCQVVYELDSGYVVTSFLRFDSAAKPIDYDVDATIPLAGTKQDDASGSSGTDSESDNGVSTEDEHTGNKDTGGDSDTSPSPAEATPPKAQQPEEPDEPSIAIDPTLTTPQARTFAAVVSSENNVSLPLWSECSEKSEILTWMELGENIEVLMLGDEWCMVQYENHRGYCLSVHIVVQPQ